MHPQQLQELGCLDVVAAQHDNNDLQILEHSSIPVRDLKEMGMGIGTFAGTSVRGLSGACCSPQKVQSRSEQAEFGGR